MRNTILAALIGIAVTGCGKPAPDAERKFDERLSKNIAEAMCSEHAPTRVSALSGIAEAAEQAQEDGGGVDQRVYDEASDLADAGCPQWAKAPNKSLQFVEKFVDEKMTDEQAEAPAQIVSAKNATTASTSASDKPAE